MKTTVEAPDVLRSTLTVGQGPSGPPGPSGGDVEGSGDLNYLHTQMSASTSWSVTHNLGKYPSVTVVDSAGDVCEGDIDYLSVNTLTLTFSAAFAGVAYLN
jgi:hypothetical protein